ncbi:hypothetical protein LOTGIDRAFT_235167 [Lottia gigantea]|uniref:Sulfatase N-terminal domain-containing protein n=1 Tax=Lottia gigantea TaxID=225164 RepID=V4BDX0_LOTGI|nr:hypothetical protein LOTGIDRAFT_235167 [Lottia gigantea]ESO86974.1 hypothetical protein LOTGIDRAFT_235167 [Lottia gigantea]
MVILRFGLLFCLLAQSCSAKRPNILFIVADDLDYCNIVYGHIVIGGRQAVCLPLQLTILPQQLKKVGYATHAVGKWHLGFCNVSCTPTYRGFDSYLGYYNAAEDYYKHVSGGFYDLHDGLKPAIQYNGTYSTYVFTNRIIDIVNQHDTNTPLFMYLPFQNVHAPIEVPKYYEDMYPHVGNLGRRRFSETPRICYIYLKGMVTILDEALGNITDRLKERGMFEDTLILFTADNGAELFAYGSNWPLRGGKHTLWEGGTRVTAFMSGRGLTQTGITYTGMVHAVDYMATLIGAAGAEQVQGIDGINQWDSIRLNQPSKRTEFIYNLDEFNIPSQGVAAIRVGDMKLLLGYPGQYDGWYRPMNDTDDFIFSINIYNSGDSFIRFYNVTVQHPDIVTKLTNRINAYRNSRVQANYPKSDPKAAEFAHRNGGTWASGWC